MAYEGFKDIKVWQRSLDFMLTVYRISSTFPVDEDVKVTGQLRNAVMTLCSCLADGYTTFNTERFREALEKASASLADLTEHATKAKSLKFLSKQDFEAIQEETKHIGDMLAVLKEDVSELLPMNNNHRPAPSHRNVAMAA